MTIIYFDAKLKMSAHYMAKKGQPRFSKDFLRAILFIIVLIALVISYRAFVKGTELRSKAAETETVAKRWDFITSSENWAVNPPAPLSVQNGLLMTTYKIENNGIGSNVGFALFTNNVNTSMPLGNKYLKLRLSVSNLGTGRSVAYGGSVNPPQVITPQQANCRLREPCLDDPKNPCRLLALVPGWCPPPSAKPTVTPIPRQPFTIVVSYFSGTTGAAPAKIQLGTLTGIADGQLKEYDLRFKEIAAVNVTGIRFDFLGLQPNASIQVDWVALTSMTPQTSCAQVITWARNTATGACQQFGSPCSIPAGWVVDYSCARPLVTPTPFIGNMPTRTPVPLRSTPTPTPPPANH